MYGGKSASTYIFVAMIHISDIAIETIELDHLALFLSKNIMIDKKFTWKSFIEN